MWASALFNTKIFTHWPILCLDPFVFRYVDTLYGFPFHQIKSPVSETISGGVMKFGMYHDSSTWHLVGTYQIMANRYMPCHHLFQNRYVKIYFLNVIMLKFKSIEITSLNMSYFGTEYFSGYYKIKKSPSLRFFTRFIHNVGGISDRRWYHCLSMCYIGKESCHGLSETPPILCIKHAWKYRTETDFLVW